MSVVVTREEIRERALDLGWDDVGITTPQIPQKHIEAYISWLNGDMHANLAYMKNAIRCYPEQLLSGAKAAIIFVSYYKQPATPLQKDRGLIAAYARGRDYHNVHRKRLKKFITWLEERAGSSSIAKGFSDSTPIMEKVLAIQAGLGWMGKNTLFIHRRYGTYTLLSGLLTTLPLPIDSFDTTLARCGSCTRCLDACPTQALTAPYSLDAARCLSYHTIESKEPIPAAIREKNPGYIFGCDICQEACPHNWRKPLSAIEEFSPDKGIGPYLTEEMLVTVESHPEKLHGTPLQRRKVEGLRHTWNALIATRQDG